MNPIKPPMQSVNPVYDYESLLTYPEYVDQKELKPMQSMLSLEELKELQNRKDDIINAINIASEKLPLHQAAGMVANLYQESKLDPNALLAGGSRGIGLALYSSGSPRARAYLNEISRQRINNKDKLNFSIRYITNEMLNSDPDSVSNSWLGRKNQLEFINTKNPVDAAHSISLKFLRPGGNPSVKLSKAYKRGEIANFIYNMYNLNNK